MFNEQGDIYSINEIPRNFMQNIVDFLEIGRKRSDKAGKLARYQGSMTRLLIEIWCATTKYRLPDRDPHQARIVALKMPGTEHQFMQIHRLLPGTRFVYCLRDPARVIRSYLNVPWSSQSFDVALRRVQDSHAALHRCMRRIPEHINVFMMSDVEGSRKRLADFLGVPDLPELPHLNSSAQYSESPRELTAEQLEAIAANQKIQRTTKMLKRHGYL